MCMTDSSLCDHFSSGVHAIRSVISQIENLTPRIISTSSEIRQQPQNSKHLQYLKTIQQEWRTNAGVLSDLSVDAVSPGDFLSTTEALAKESLTKCREALAELNFGKLTSEISLLVGISEKAVNVCRTEIQRAADPLFKSRLTEVTSRVNSGKKAPYLMAPYQTKPCYAIPCRAMPWHPMPCHAISCQTRQCHAIPYRTISYRTIPYHTIQCCFILFILCNTMPYHAMPCRIILTLLYHTMPCCIILCTVIYHVS